MVDKKLLAVKQAQRANKPTAMRHDAHKKKRVGTKWRKPKGIQNKMRLNKRGYRRGIEHGYSGPKALRSTHFAEGKEIVRVSNQKELVAVDGSSQIVVLANCGTRKRYELVALAQERKIDIMNIDDAAAFLKDVESVMKDRKAGREKVAAKRKEKESKKPKKAVEDKVAEEKSAEDIKKEEKKEKDKVLTQSK